MVVTGDLFLRDADGDYWRVDGVGDVIRARQGLVFTIPIRDALADLEAADLGVAYGVVPPGARARGSSGGGDAPRRATT